jgi:hypothetical protein
MVRRLHEFDTRLRLVENRQEESAGELEDRFDVLTADVQEWIRRSKDQYLGWRIIGLGIALTGAGFLAAANLVETRPSSRLRVDAIPARYEPRRTELALSARHIGLVHHRAHRPFAGGPGARPQAFEGLLV